MNAFRHVISVEINNKNISLRWGLNFEYYFYSTAAADRQYYVPNGTITQYSLKKLTL
ncbi:hypothetical protein [Emticicia sp.]|uniref:hypothetical protein n=1 Tax=Emticicia sp. TaxID=1930953 RepID=UPI003752337B